MGLSLFMYGSTWIDSASKRDAKQRRIIAKERASPSGSKTIPPLPTFLNNL